MFDLSLTVAVLKQWQQQQQHMGSLFYTSKKTRNNLYMYVRGKTEAFPSFPAPGPQHRGRWRMSGHVPVFHPQQQKKNDISKTIKWELRRVFNEALTAIYLSDIGSTSQPWPWVCLKAHWAVDMLLMAGLNFGESKMKARHAPAFAAQWVAILSLAFSSVLLVEFQ